MQIFNSECLTSFKTSLTLALFKADMQTNENIIMTSDFLFKWKHSYYFLWPVLSFVKLQTTTRNKCNHMSLLICSKYALKIEVSSHNQKIILCGRCFQVFLLSDRDYICILVFYFLISITNIWHVVFCAWVCMRYLCELVIK